MILYLWKEVWFQKWYIIVIFYLLLDNLRFNLLLHLFGPEQEQKLNIKKSKEQKERGNFF